MQPRTCLLSALTLSTGMAFGAAAMAAELPKSGTYSGTYSASGTFKVTPVGKNRLLGTWDENGLSVGSGILDHVTWHCFGLQEVTNGIVHHRGYCVGTDPDGDQVVVRDARDETYAADAKSFKLDIELASGTGKYAGISGGHTFVAHGPEFHAAAEGTYLQYGTYQGTYKLP